MVDATTNPDPDPLPGHRRRWLLLTGTLVLLALGGVVVLALSTAGPLERGPAVYGALAVSGLSAIGAFILTFAHGFYEHLSPSTKQPARR